MKTSFVTNSLSADFIAGHRYTVKSVPYWRDGTNTYSALQLARELSGGPCAEEAALALSIERMALYFAKECRGDNPRLKTMISMGPLAVPYLYDMTTESRVLNMNSETDGLMKSLENVKEDRR
jgi:hypothetical protein